MHIRANGFRQQVRDVSSRHEIHALLLCCEQCSNVVLDPGILFLIGGHLFHMCTYLQDEATRGPIQNSKRMSHSLDVIFDLFLLKYLKHNNSRDSTN